MELSLASLILSGLLVMVGPSLLLVSFRKLPREEIDQVAPESARWREIYPTFELAWTWSVVIMALGLAFLGVGWPALGMAMAWLYLPRGVYAVWTGMYPQISGPNAVFCVADGEILRWLGLAQVILGAVVSLLCWRIVLA